MHEIKLKGANPEEIAKMVGGTLIMYNATDDVAIIAGGDISKIEEYLES
ncbi:MAG: hypothetical protein HXO49_02270 [Prevotella sp.]|nr:hypothetical protein [Prevotella sp.]